MQRVIIESQYAGCAGWWALAVQAPVLHIDLAGNYQKGSLRNRCYILSPNDVLRLSVPLDKGKYQRKCMKDVRINYSGDWQKIHWMSLVSCYRRSAYFEYYEQDIKPVFESDWIYLHELNEMIVQKVDDLLGLELMLQNEEVYMLPEHFEGIDLRDHIWDPAIFPEYPQVFSDRHPFVPNLGIWDLLFNLGPKTKDYLLSIDLSSFWNRASDSL